MSLRCKLQTTSKTNQDAITPNTKTGYCLSVSLAVHPKLPAQPTGVPLSIVNLGDLLASLASNSIARLAMTKFKKKGSARDFRQSS